MDEKWDIHTIFRLVLPAFISMSVVYSFGKEFPSQTEILGFTFFSIPIGYIFLTIYRGLYKYGGFQELLTERDANYIINEKKLTPLRTMPGEVPWHPNYYYASTIDFIIDSDVGIKGLSTKIRFLYTQMHAFGAAGTAIFITDGGCSLFYHSNTYWGISTLWLSIGILMFFLRDDISERIFVWRRILIDNYENFIQNLLNGDLNRNPLA